MFFTEECVGAQCNNCGKVYEDFSGVAVWADKENLHPEEDGWHVDGDIHYCHQCHVIDDDDKLVVMRIPPVYEVIAEFPGNKDFPVGKRIEFHPWESAPNLYWEHSVEDCQGRRTWLSDYFEKFPHLFRKVFKPPARQENREKIWRLTTKKLRKKAIGQPVYIMANPSAGALSLKENHFIRKSTNDNRNPQTNAGGS